MTDPTITLSIFDYLSASAAFDWFVNHADYLMVFLLMTIESTFIPFPSEVVVVPAAFLAMTGAGMNIFLVVIFATAGALTGALINYYLSLWLGRPIVYAFANSRVGHFFLLNNEKVEKAEKYFDKHGAVSTFIGRLIPVVRQLISIPAGLARMNVSKFVIFTLLGAFVWNCVLALFGYLLSKAVTIDQLYEAIEKYNPYLTIGGLCLLGICLLYMLYKAFTAKKHQTENQ